MASDSEARALADHQQWLGYVQPVGLLVSPTALLDCQAYVDRNIGPQQRALLGCLKGEPPGYVEDFVGFAQSVLGWKPGDCIRVDTDRSLSERLSVSLPEYGQILVPTYCACSLQGAEDGAAIKPCLLVKELALGQDFDRAEAGSSNGWNAAPQVEFERLLRETDVAVGILFNGSALRLVYSPKGENSGHITFPFEAMAGVAGRPILAALHMLLCAERLFGLPTEQRLPALLAHSRNAQSRVSEQLAGQVLAALYEMVRGFQAANAASKGELLGELLARDPETIYKGVLTVLMRLVFLLYAEDRGLMASGPVYSNHYSVAGLFLRLRADAALHPDTMEQRYGAWAQLLVLFRLVYGGVKHPELSLPAREGYLFDPERYRFLEGGGPSKRGVKDSAVELPRISDRVVYRVLEKLMVLDGQRLSYRTLDVEQIGSVYETMIGFDLIVASGGSVVLRAGKAGGAPEVVNLEQLLMVEPQKRVTWLKEQTGIDIKGRGGDAVRAAGSVSELLVSLEKRIDREITPAMVPAGAMLLHPTDERRRSGSHYTPRKLTEPIVRKALEPVLAGLGPQTTPEEILGLKICDPAMGSGAFLVEVCRQLADRLVAAWRVHQKQPSIPPDEDETLHARRLVAQRCLYGVDRNPMAVDLARLSLWLATLAKNHPFTFLDHVLHFGDSLVGLTTLQIARGAWDEAAEPVLGQQYVLERVGRVRNIREEILSFGDAAMPSFKAAKLRESEQIAAGAKLCGDVVLAAFFDGDNAKQREARRLDLTHQLAQYLQTGNLALRPAAADALRNSTKPVVPFHWELEFAEVFGRDNAGFDAIVGNPPFAGKNTLIAANRKYYPQWLDQLHEESNGNTDLAAHFFRRAFNLLRSGGTMGLVATNTIAQGDTRSTGLRYICTHGGTIYAARRRYKWPGQAAVVVSIVHILKICPNMPLPPCELDGRNVEQITAFLFHAGGHEDPHRLAANASTSFIGSYILGMGFTFDDTDKWGIASPIAEMHRLIGKDPRNAERIFPYIGGEEICTSPTHAHHRYAINFGEMTLEQAKAWPDLLGIVEARVRPERMEKDPVKYPRMVHEWWKYWCARPELYAAIAPLNRVLAICRVTQHLAPAFLPNGMVYADSTVIIAMERFSAFAVLQCRLHEIWTRFFASSLEERLRYTPTDCFETFPFPECFESNQSLEDAGKAYYEFRARLMVQNNQGLTETYNRFHDPADASAEITELRRLHGQLDRAVLDAYGWNDWQPQCEFILDYEEEQESEPGEPSAPSKKKKPWRYRWPDAMRDEVLGRLLELNRERHSSSNSAPHKPSAPPASPNRRARRSAATAPTLFSQGSLSNNANTSVSDLNEGGA